MYPRVPKKSHACERYTHSLSLARTLYVTSFISFDFLDSTPIDSLHTFTLL
jgi:hypothetical protein